MSTDLTPALGLRWFINLTKALPSRFQRTRTWSPQSIMVWLMLMTRPDRKTAYRSSLVTLQNFGLKSFGWTKRPSLSSVSEARRKMTIPMCREVLQTVVSQCHTSMGRTTHRYGDRRFIAFDGTRLVTRRSADTAKKLHRYKSPNGKRVNNPQGLMVAAVDVFRRLPLDWILVGKGKGERTALKKLLDTLNLVPGDVAVMDRGLPSRSLFSELLARQVDIVARMSTSDVIGWIEVEAFLKSGMTSAVIDVLVGEKGDRFSVRARLVERPRQPGRPRKGTKKERMVILTTLRQENGFSPKEIIKIYGARWGIESLFGELKSFMNIEPFHTKLVSGVEQEIAASLIWMALASSMQAEAERTLDGRRVVRVDCLRGAADLIGDLLEGRSVTDAMERWISGLRQYSYAPRPDRHAPRVCKMPFGRSVQRGPR
jgi:Transposase DDE domain